jgi:hypothetical protein
MSIFTTIENRSSIVVIASTPINKRMKKIDTLIRGVLLCALALIFSPTILFAQVEQTQPCGSDQTSQYKKARTAVHAAAVTVFGQKFDECAIEGWVSSIKFNNAYESFRQKYNAADFQFSDALAFLKLQLADAQKSKLRQTAVKNAIMEVRGRDYLTEPRPADETAKGLVRHDCRGRD